MARLLLHTYDHGCGTPLSWWFVILGLASLLGLGFLSAIIYKVVSFRVFLHRGRVPANRCLAVGEQAGGGADTICGPAKPRVLVEGFTL
jgi:hypothetical protein